MPVWHCFACVCRQVLTSISYHLLEVFWLLVAYEIESTALNGHISGDADWPLSLSLSPLRTPREVVLLATADAERRSACSLA